MGRIGCSETSVNNLHNVLRNIPEEGRFHDEKNNIIKKKSRLVFGPEPVKPGSIPGQSVWDLWWKYLQWDRFLGAYFCFVLSILFH